LKTKTGKKKGKKRRQSSRGLSTSAEAAALAIAILNLGADKSLIEGLLKLALRAPNELIRNWLRSFLEQQRVSVDSLLSGEPTTPASKAELIQLATPALKAATDCISVAQLIDLYLIKKSQSPDDLVFAFYIGVRLYIANERVPSKDESKRIWEIVLLLTHQSKIGARHLQELERRGQIYVEDWLEGVKDKARKKFQTFLNQKRQIEKNADRSFHWLLAFLFDSNESD
jgi:hypothetical protein